MNTVGEMLAMPRKVSRARFTTRDGFILARAFHELVLVFTLRKRKSR